MSLHKTDGSSTSSISVTSLSEPIILAIPKTQQKAPNT